MYVYGTVLKVQRDISQVCKPSQQQSPTGSGSRPSQKSSGSGPSGERSSASSQQQSLAGNGSRLGHKSSGSGLSETLTERTLRADDRHDDWHGATSSSVLIPQARKCVMDAAF